jgi:hypothetical protein
MGVLHPLPQHALRMAALAALTTLAVVAAVPAIPFRSLSSHDTSSGPPTSTGAAISHRVHRASPPDWVAHPLAPVTLASTRDRG